MTVRHLDKMFHPKSVAFIGASEKTGSLGQTVAGNLLASGFKGEIMFVNPKHKKIAGRKCYPSPEALPAVPDLAIIATPAQTVPDLVDRLGKKGVRAAVIITAGVDQQAILDASRPSCLRMIGPNCFGLMIPSLGLNGSFSHLAPQAGDLAFISQSGAVISAVIDWAASHNIGFSDVISLGNMADVDIGDTLDYLATDSKSRAILIYMEHVTNARKFMSAARAAARIKPVILIKTGRHASGAKAAASHTGALAGSDSVYDAAFRRAGLLRVTELEELFDAAAILNCAPPVMPGRLTIVTNGGGAGVMAADRLSDYGGTAASLAPGTLEALDAFLPALWSKGNPVDIIGDAGPERYVKTIETILQDKNTDAVLVMNCPTALASSPETARAVADVLKNRDHHGKTVMACWMGDRTARKARSIFSDSGIASFETPEGAIRGYTYLAAHARLQEELMRTPPARPDEVNADRETVQTVIKTALDAGRSLLTEAEAKIILSAYGIPVVATEKAENPRDVHDIACRLLKSENKIVVKILSDRITHKSDSGGVALDIDNPDQAEKAAQDMLERLGSDISGFTVQPMIQRPGAHELILGVATDPVFGPVILFGAGGTGAEIIDDKAVALPPLDLRLARDLMERTRIFRLLQGYRNRPAADINAIAAVLVKLSQIIADIPEIRELDINPCLVDDKGILALDARIIVKDGLRTPMAIRPYPRQWEGKEILPGGRTISIRPIRPEDERYYPLFASKMDPEDIRHRFFTTMNTLSHSFIAKLTQIDYARAMAFVAINPETDEMLGVARLCADPDYKQAEFAVVTRSDQKRKGIGRALMKSLIRYATAEGIENLWGQVMAENNAMLNMCRNMNFQNRPDARNPCIFQTSLELKPDKL